MQVSIQFNVKGIKEVSIGGEIETEDDVEELIQQLKITEGEKVAITFIDANMIKKAIVERLHLLQELKHSQVYVLKQYLYAYLHKLGISCKYIQREVPLVAGINHKDTSYVGEAQFDNYEVMEFLKNIYKRYGYDYTEYQIESIMRRIKISMVRQGIKFFNDFKRIVLENEGLFEQLFIDFSINTTDFFRDPEVFAELRERVLPYLNNYTHIKIWCAGCSTGQEPYSLAILLEEMDMLDKVQIYATDINPYVIEEAKNGLFPINGMDRYINNYRTAKGKRGFVKYFKLHGKYMEIDEGLKNNILFFQHSLVGSGILNEFQLILCRNVLIYLDASLQKNILENFYHSLDLSGFLVLGKSEGILNNEGTELFYNYLQQDRKIFRKKDRKNLRNEYAFID